MENLLLTMFVAVVIGYVFLKFKVPGGMMVGSIIGVSLLNITSGSALMIPAGKVGAQIIAGAFIAVGLEKSDLRRLKSIFKPAAILLIGMLIVNIVSGFLIYNFSSLDLTTSLMCAVPGGMSNIPLISEEMGADSSKVAVMQFIRLLLGIGVFPFIISKVSNLEHFKEAKQRKEIYKRTKTSNDSKINLIITMIVATTAGLFGKWTGIPSAILVFAMIATIVLKLTTNRVSMPRWMRRFAQVLSGAYIGSSIEMGDVIEMKGLILPAIIMILGYLIACFIIGSLIHRNTEMAIDESMLAATPAGASDMALISADIGIESADVIVLQVIRMLTVVSIFPQIIRGLVYLFG